MGIYSRCLTQLVLVLLLFPGLSLRVSADYEAGLKAYKRNDFQRARAEFFQSAVAGHAGAQYYLGEIYEGGVGVSVNYTNAFKWYRSAARQKHAMAQRRLAYLYSQGLGTQKNEARAFAWYLRAADNGDVLGQLEAGLRYRQGRGVEKDPIKAYKWLTIAASYGDPDALSERRPLEAGLSDSDRQQASILARDWERRRESRDEPAKR